MSDRVWSGVVKIDKFLGANLNWIDDFFVE